MEVLSVGGKDYVKASVIARDLGYTSDYVGQLCRSRKVNAKLVGRSWYVDRNSIHLHKSNRYRSALSKTKESLREEIEVLHSPDTGFKVPVHLSHTPTASPVKKPAYVSYSEDPAELIPVVSKTPAQSLEVKLADAQTVNVTSESGRYVFNTPKLPEIKFKGSVPVVGLDDDEIEANDTPSTKVAHPKWVNKLSKKAKNIDISAVPVHVEASPASEDLATVAESALAHNPQPESKQLHVVEENHIPVSKRVLAASAVFSFGLVVFLWGLQSSVSVAGSSLTSSYSFALDNLSASAYASVENFQSILYVVEFSTNLFFF